MSLIKEAERNVINQAKAWDDALKFVDALISFGNRACHDHVAKKEFFEGINIIRNAMRHEQSEAIRNCFLFAGVGGEDANKFSREMFEKAFGGNYEIMSFLNQWGQIPSWYKTDEEKEFRKELDEKLK